MKSFSAFRFGAALCASIALIPWSFGQSPAPDPEHNPGERYPSQNPGTSEDELLRARDRELSRMGEAQPLQNSSLESASQKLGSATYAEREQIVTTLESSIKAAKQEETDLRKSAAGLRDSSRGKFNAAAQVAETRRQSLVESCDQLKNSKAEEWDVRKRNVATDLEIYQQALDRARQVAGQPRTGQPSAKP